MTIKKKRKTVKRKRKPRRQVEVPENIPVQVIPDPPKISKVEAARKGLWRLLLFLFGLTPTCVWAFQIVVLRIDVHPDIPFVLLMLVGSGISFAVANISDDKLSKSAREITPIIRGVMKTRTGNTATDNKVVVRDK